MDFSAKIRIWCARFGAVVLACMPAVAHACPMCFSGNGQNQDAFLYGSLFLMVVPTTALGGLGYWAYRRIKAAEAAYEPPPRPQNTGEAGEAVVLHVVERR
jgi:hypothetical protein